MKERSSFLSFLGIPLLIGSGYLVWRNRFRIQKFLEAQGISTMWLTGDIEEAVKSGAAKVSGKVEHAVNSVNTSNDREGRRVAS